MTPPGRGAARPARPAADRPADGRAARPGRRPRRARRREDLRARPTTRPTGPRGATRSRAGATRPRADRLRRQRVRAPELAWTQRCFAVALAWLWDERLYDHAAGRFTPERFLADAERFGGFDGDRALARVPGDRDRRAQPVRLVPRRAGPRASSSPTSRRAASASSSTTTRGTSARAASRSPTRRRCAGLVRELGADGLFLDTMKEARPALTAALGPGVALEGESTVPLARDLRPPPVVGAVVRRQPRARRAPRAGGSSSGTCSTTRAAGTAATSRSCTARG